jgi:hypothetical protein
MIWFRQTVRAGFCPGEDRAFVGRTFRAPTLRAVHHLVVVTWRRTAVTVTDVP